MKHSIVLLCLIFSSIFSFSQDIEGQWNGKIRKTQFVFTFHKANQSYETIIDIPSQRISTIKPQKTVLFKDSIVVDASNVGIVFKGKIDLNAKKIVGALTENANVFPITLIKGEIKAEKVTNRPQEPVKPYPYMAEEVSFTNKKDAVSLSGTLTIPNNKGKHPAVVLITGSGPQDRDQTFAGHKTFLVLADYLTRNGIAVLRYDDRGFGKSTGIFTEATTYDFATDVISAFEYLKSRRDIDSGKIGLIGHSEGGIIAPLAANRSKDVSFIVSMAGTGIIGSELVLAQILEQRSFPVPNEEEYKNDIRKALSIAAQKKELAIVQEELKAHYYKTTVPIIKPFIGSDEKVAQIISNIVKTRTTKWARYFYNYNPADEMAKLKVPALYIIGNNDKQVLPEMNLSGIRSAFEKNERNNNKIIELEGLNHLFQESQTGEMSEYNSISQTIAPIALREITVWIKSNLK